MRLTCKRCGVAVIMPLSSTHTVPDKCSNCSTTLLADEMLDVIHKLKYFRSDIGKPDVPFLAHLEVRQP